MSTRQSCESCELPIYRGPGGSWWHSGVNDEVVAASRAHNVKPDHTPCPGGGLPEYATLVALVQWLALSYGTNEPVFAGADGLGTVDGVPAANAEELRAAYRAVVGVNEEPRAGDRWEKCAGCGHWGLVRDLPEPVIVDPGGPTA